MLQTVNLESLSAKIFGQFLTFIQKKVREVNERPSYIPKSKIPKDLPINDDDEDVHIGEPSESLTGLNTLLAR